jgi:hypothetical protein
LLASGRRRKKTGKQTAPKKMIDWGSLASSILLVVVALVLIVLDCVIACIWIGCA